MQPNKIKFKILLESAVLANNLITGNFTNAVSGAERRKIQFPASPRNSLRKIR